jgi:hypothetical protein
MTSRALGALALKIWGLTIAIAAVTAFPASLAAIVVWSDRIVSFFVAEEPPLEIENISMVDIVPLTFGVVGIFVLVDGVRNVAEIAYALYVALYAKQQFDESTASYVWERQYEAIVRAIPQSPPAFF